MILTKYLQSVEIDEEHVLLVNSLSGAIDMLKKELWESVPSKLMDTSTDNHDSDDDTIRQLKERGYIFDSEAEEKAAIEDLGKTVKKLSSKRGPVAIVICPTYNCNFRCQYCYEGLDLRTSKEHLRANDIDLIFDGVSHIIQSRQPPGVEVELFGGEPLLPRNKDVVQRVLEHCDRLHYPLTIITNGSTIASSETLKSQLRLYKNIIIKLQITVDGIQELHDKRRPFANGKGSFGQIVKAIDWLIAEEIKVAMRVNVDSENIKHLPGLTEFICEKGWKDSPHFMAGLAPVTDHTGKQPPNILPEDKVVEQILELQQSDSRMEEAYLLSMFRVLGHVAHVAGLRPGEPSLPMFQYCETNSLSFFVFGADGLIYACPEAIGNERYAIGRFKPDFELYEEKMKLWDGRNILRIKKCSDCSVATFCGGGCAYAALETNDDIDEPVCKNAPEVLDTFIRKNRHKILEATGENVCA